MYVQSTKVKSTRRDGESMTAYKRRLKQEMRDFLADEIRNQKHVKAKAKQYVGESTNAFINHKKKKSPHTHILTLPYLHTSFFKEKARKQKHKKEKKINAREVRHLQRSVSDLVTVLILISFSLTV